MLEPSRSAKTIGGVLGDFEGVVCVQLLALAREAEATFANLGDGGAADTPTSPSSPSPGSSDIRSSANHV